MIQTIKEWAMIASIFITTLSFVLMITPGHFITGIIGTVVGLVSSIFIYDNL